MTTNTDDRIPLRLTSAPVVIRDAGFKPIDYRLIRDAAINGVIPAHQRNGIWHFYREDAPVIATALRLVPFRTETVSSQSSKLGRRTQTIAA